MAYDVNNFFVRVSQSDSLLHLKDTSGKVQWTINAFDIVSSFVSNNLLKINTKTEYIQLDFGNSTLSKMALTNLQNQIKLLREKVPVQVPTEIKNYVVGYVASQVLSGPQGAIGGTGPQGVIGGTGSQGFIGVTGSQGNQGATGSADKYQGTSSTSLQIPQIGYIVDLITQPGLAYTDLQSVIVSSNPTYSYVYDYVYDYVEGDDPSYFIGHLVYYDNMSGDMSIVVDTSYGYGLTNNDGSVATFSTWYINLTGQSGGVSITNPIAGSLLLSDGTTSGVTTQTGLIYDGTFSVTSPILLENLTQFQQTMEVINIATASGTMDFDFSQGAIWITDTSILSSTFSVNISNVPTDLGKVYTFTLMFNQLGLTASLPYSYTINNVSYPLYWSNSTPPIGTVGNLDIIGLSFIGLPPGGLIAQHSTYGV
jgi:hypothetical protein